MKDNLVNLFKGLIVYHLGRCWHRSWEVCGPEAFYGRFFYPPKNKSFGKTWQEEMAIYYMRHPTENIFKINPDYNLVGLWEDVGEASIKRIYQMAMKDLRKAEMVQVVSTIQRRYKRHPTLGHVTWRKPVEKKIRNYVLTLSPLEALASLHPTPNVDG
jgi:hypothetical protein